jgi:hypothetical protein
VLSEPLTNAVSELTNLNSLSLHSDSYHFEDDIDFPLLPAAAAVLTGLQHLDVDDHTLPPAVEALTGKRAVTSPSLTNVH